MKENIAGLDPGKDKCGIAVIDSIGKELWREIAATVSLGKRLQELHSRYGFSRLVMGNGTTSKKAGRTAAAALPEVQLIVVDEYRTTDAARVEYWKINKPKGWRKLLPQGLLVPPEPVDDIAAMILARRYAEQNPPEQNQ